MRFFHISDLHIGKQLYGYHLIEDQKYVLRQIIDAMEKEQPDALLIAGDIYDKPVPSGEAVTLFDWFLTEVSKVCLQTPILIIAGNHDSAKRIDYAGDILSRQNIHIVGTPPQKQGDEIYKITQKDEFGEVDFYLLPFFKPANLRTLFSEDENYESIAAESGPSEYEIYFEKLLARQSVDERKRNVLLTHQFYVPGDGTAVERTESEVITVGTLEHISTAHLAPFEYVAMGHIHRGQRCGQERYRYSGTPMPYSLSEENDSKAITVVTLAEKGREAEIETIPLKPLRRIRKCKGTKKELIQLAKAEAEERKSRNPDLEWSEGIDDYVSLIVTDEEPGRFVREELGMSYSHILEIRYDNQFMRQLIGESQTAPLSNNYFEMFEQFYEMRNGNAMSEEEKQILSKMLDSAQEEEE